MSTHIENINNHDGGVINIHHLEHKVPSQLTSKLGKSTIIGRDKELKEIEQKLDNSDTLLINGVGGVGKSTIASNYLHTHKEQYDYYGFFEGINGFIRELESAFDIEKKLGRDSLLDILREFRGLENSKKLLVIDDVKEIEKNKEQIDKILALKEHGCKILLTSREQIEGVEIYSLDVLTVTDAKALFNSIFKMEDASLLEEIVTYLDCHAFFVEMTATSLSVNRERTPEKMIEMFRSGNLSKIKANKEQSFNDFLNKQFSLDSLDDEDSLLLKKLSLLPSIEIDFKFLTMIFGLTDEEDIEDLKDLLNFLVEKGWLSSNGQTYKLHQIIKEFIWANHQPTLQEIDKVVLFFAKLIKNNNDIQSAVLLKGYLVYFESIDDVLNKVGVFNESLTEFWNNLGLIYEYNGLYSEALSFYIKIMKIIEKVLGEGHPDTASSYNNLAGLYESMGEYKKSKPLHLKALKIREKVLGKEHPDTASSYNNLAGLHRSMGEYRKSKILYLKALKIRKKMWGEEHSTTSFSYNNLAVLYQSMGEYKKAEQLSLKALKIVEKVLGEEHPTTATYYNNLATLYQSIGEYKKSESFYLKVLKIVEKVLGEEHPDTASSYNNLAKLYQSMGEYQKSKPLYLKALNIREKVLGEEHPSTASSYNNLAKLYESMEEYEKVEILSLKALRINKKVLGEDHPIIASSYNNLAKLYLSMGEYQKSKPLYLKALNIREKVLGNEHPSTASSYNNLAKLYQLRGEYKEVEALSLKALMIFEKVLGEEHLNRASSYNNLGIFYYEQGEFEKAHVYMKKAVTVRTKVLPEEHSDLIKSKEWLEMIQAELHKKI